VFVASERSLENKFKFRLEGTRASINTVAKEVRSPIVSTRAVGCEVSRQAPNGRPHEPGSKTRVGAFQGSKVSLMIQSEDSQNANRS
jgi:hypothetical protein